MRDRADNADRGNCEAIDRIIGLPPGQDARPAVPANMVLSEHALRKPCTCISWTWSSCIENAVSTPGHKMTYSAVARWKIAITDLGFLRRIAASNL